MSPNLSSSGNVFWINELLKIVVSNGKKCLHCNWLEFEEYAMVYLILNLANAGMMFIFFNSNFNRVQQMVCRIEYAFTRGNVSRLCKICKKSLRISAISLLFVINFSFSIGVILEEVYTLSVKSGFTVFQNFLLSVTEFISRLP